MSEEDSPTAIVKGNAATFQEDQRDIRITVVYRSASKISVFVETAGENTGKMGADQVYLRVATKNG